MQLQNERGEFFQLEQEIAQGGEARIWTLAHEPHLLAKIYGDPTSAREAKLRAMLVEPPRQPRTHTAFAWPTDLLFAQKRFVGFLMPRVMDARPILHYYNPALRRQIPSEYPWSYFLHHCARNLAIAVSAIHARGHVVGDLNESNTLVDGRALVTLVDTDSFQIRDPNGQNPHRCTVAKAEFVPPELQGVALQAVDRREEHDRFSLSVLIFLLLMEGYHPYSGVLSTGASVGRVDLYCIQRGWFPYAGRFPVDPPPRAPAFYALHPEIQEMFRISFVKGHRRIRVRPAASEWNRVLNYTAQSLVVCAQEQQHMYSDHLPSCPHCHPHVLTPPRQWAVSVGQQIVKRAHTALVARPPARPSSNGLLSGPPRWLARPRKAWQTVTMRASRTHRGIREIYGEVQKTAASSLAKGLWVNWTLANVIGVGMSYGVAALMLFAMMPGIESPLFSLPSAEMYPLLIGGGVGAILGGWQWWSMRGPVFRYESRATGRMAASWSAVQWTLRTALAGAWGALLLMPGPGWLSPVMLAILFGAGLGLLQSGGLQPYLRPARDARRWMLVNACAWLLVGVGWSLGNEFGDQQGALVGSSVGLVLTSMLTGFVLTWMARFPAPRAQRTWAAQMVRRLQRWRLPRWSHRQWLGVYRNSVVRRWSQAAFLLALLMLAVQALQAWAEGVLK